MSDEMKMSDMKFNSWKDKTAFILLNIFGSPLAILAFIFMLGWGGFILNVGLFLMCFFLWKHYGAYKKDLKLKNIKFNPKIGV